MILRERKREKYGKIFFSQNVEKNLFWVESD
jgi:hypothetical protein